VRAPAKILLFLLALSLASGPVLGHGSIYPPPEEDEPERPPPPDPPPPPPEWDPEAPQDPPPAPTPAPAPPKGPQPPSQPGQGPGTGGPTTRPTARSGARGRASGGEATWRIWWELNREYLVGLRGLLRQRVTLTGPEGGRVRTDPLGPRRPEVVDALRRVAARGSGRQLRAAALIALGRTGVESDARLCVALLKDDRQPRDVREGAAIALGILPPFEHPATRRSVAAYLAYVLEHPSVLPSRARGLTILAMGMRARNDPLLRMQLVGYVTGGLPTGEEAANVAYACGLTGDAMVVPELLRAARKGALAGQRLSDAERSLAVQSLALLGDPHVVGTVVRVVRSRRAGLETTRGAALALGRILREQELDDTTATRAEQALRQVFEKSNDSALRGFCAVGLGGARRPAAIATLRDSIDRGGNTEVKPYCALALGLAARTLGEEDGKKIRAFLVEELRKSRQLEVTASLTIALGLARAHEATDSLIERLGDQGVPAPSRAAAAQALGLMGATSPAAADALLRVAKRESSGQLLEDAVLALGLMGQRAVAEDLVALLPKAGSSQTQGRIILALSYLNHSAAVEPLLKVLTDPRQRTLGREFAAVALGLLGDPRDEDVLFKLDAHFNFFSGTRASRELVRLY
jgi:HEAT repeat protein